MKHFGSIQEIREASVEKLAEVPEIPENVANQIYEFFHQENE
jgi:excinuclease ABC subunit C